jgi:hypothetical protein
MHRSLVCVYLCVLVSVLVSGPVSGQITDPSEWKVAFDRISAHSARARFYGAQDQLTTMTATIVQYSNVSSLISQNLQTFHMVFIGAQAGTVSPGDVEVTLPQNGNSITSYTLRNLNPSTTYQVRVGAYQNAAGSTSPSQATYYPSNTYTTTYSLQTPALSTVTTSSLLVSNGCGQLTSDGTMYYLTQSVDAFGTIVYQCDVTAEINNVTITLVPNQAYATINTATTPALAANALSASTIQSYVDPLTQYNTSVTLNGQGATTNFTWSVTSESGSVQSYTLTVRRASPSNTTKIAGPSSPIVAMIKSPANATVLQYRGLTWSATTISKWKVWSDDPVTFPFTSLTLTAANTSITNTLLVSTTTASSPDGACANVYVALFDQNGNSQTYTTCISAINDYCSSTPFGAATKWQNPWGNVQSTFLPANANASSLYFPAPPYPTFPIA